MPKGKKRTPRGERGKLITQAHKEAKLRRQKAYGNTKRRHGIGNVLCSGIITAVRPRDIAPKTLEQLRRFNKKVKPENKWVTNINSVFNCGRFPISELMEKPIKYRRAS